MTTHRKSVRREIRSVERGLKQFQHEVGDYVTYYELDPAQSTENDIYDEGWGGGAGLVYKIATYIPAVWVRFFPPTHPRDPDGLYTVSNLMVRFSVQTMRLSGLRYPLDPTLHFDDRIGYNGYLYRIDQYEPKGWLHGNYLMIDIAAEQLKADELTTDATAFSETEPSPWSDSEDLSWPPPQTNHFES